MQIDRNSVAIENCPSPAEAQRAALTSATGARASKAQRTSACKRIVYRFEEAANAQMLMGKVFTWGRASL